MARETKAERQEREAIEENRREAQRLLADRYHRRNAEQIEEQRKARVKRRRGEE